MDDYDFQTNKVNTAHYFLPFRRIRNGQMATKSTQNRRHEPFLHAPSFERKKTRFFHPSEFPVPSKYIVELMIKLISLRKEQRKNELSDA